MSKTVCLRCGYPITWDDQKRQWGRLMRRGVSPEEGKALMPRCQKCNTITIGRKRRGQSAADQPNQRSQ
jgi:hypothetical protein